MKLTYADPASVQMDAAILNGIGPIALKALAEGYTQAVHTLIARHGKIVYHKAFGNLTLAPDSPPAPPDALYKVYSITKVMTAVSIMQLQERGLLRFDDPVQKFLPEFVGEGKDEVTIAHLLTHTSGLRDDDVYQQFQAGEDRRRICAKPARLSYVPYGGEWWWDALLKAPLAWPAGKEMSYAGSNYKLLGAVVKAVSGQSIGVFAKHNLIDPLGMKDTGYTKTAAEVRGRVVERRPMAHEKVSHMSDPKNFGHMSGDNSASSTAYDLAVLGQMFLNRGVYGDVRILSEESIRLMTENQTWGITATWGDRFFEESGWSYGLNTSGIQDGFPTRTSYRHEGYAGACMLMDPQLDMVMVVLTALNMDPPINVDGIMETAVQACTDYDYQPEPSKWRR